MYKITQKIKISAGAIRSRARQLGLSTLTQNTAHKLWDAQHDEQPETIAGQFYLSATERQVTRVINLAVKGYMK